MNKRKTSSVEKVPGLKYSIFEIWTQMISRQVFKWLIKKWCGLSIYGQENLQGMSQCIFAPTHASHLDFWVVLEGLPPGLVKKTYIAAAADFFYKSMGRRLITRFFSYHNFPFKRHAYAVQEYHQLKKIIEQGFSLLVFAQGTRMRNKELLPFKPLLAMLALDTQVPIVPVVIGGTLEALPAGRVWPRRKPLKLIFGKPLDTQKVINSGKRDLVSKSARVLNQALEKQIKSVWNKI